MLPPTEERWGRKLPRTGSLWVRLAITGAVILVAFGVALLFHWNG